jgi:muramoyltetrapeptide carboxypeptidase
MGPGKPLSRPSVLRKGDCVGLVAPSSPFQRDAVEHGIRFIEEQGFVVRHRADLFARRSGFLAGGDQERADEMHEMFEDPEIRAVFVVRGGYGAQRILDRLDPSLLERHPKIFLGYSDATCLLTFLLQRVGLVCFHGPVVSEMGALSELTRNCLLQLLTGCGPLGPIPAGGIRWIRKGLARAPIVGGNLSLVCSTLGTPWELDTQGRILLLEDRGEKPYRVDRLLIQLRQAGKLSSIAGLLFGGFERGQPGENELLEREYMNEVLRENTRDLDVPVACDLPVGHGQHNLALPFGVLAEMNGREGRVSILEPAVNLRE